MGWFSDSDEDKFGVQAVAKRKQALKMKELRSAQGEQDAFLKQKEAFESGADMSKASSGASSLSKGAAAASMAQEMGAVPKDGAVGGAVSGAAAGATFGPWGAAIGGVAGAVMGQAKARAAKKAEEAALQRKKYERISEIEEEKGKNIASAYSTMTQNMLAALG